MEHDFVVDSVETHQVIFKCSVCLRTNGLVKPDYGTPCATPDGSGGWLPWEGLQKHWGPCEGAPS